VMKDLISIFVMMISIHLDHAVHGYSVKRSVSNTPTLDITIHREVAIHILVPAIRSIYVR
jgi:hypothetical protein